MITRPVALTIAGSDPSGGAGIQQDVRVFTCLKVYSCAVIAALTVQNTQGVKDVYPVSSTILARQLEAIFEDFLPNSIKLGMLATKENVEVVAEFLTRFMKIPVIADPVMLSKNDKELLDKMAMGLYIEKLLPVVDILTPNLDEAGVIVGRKILNLDDMKYASDKILHLMKTGRKSPYEPVVIIKGGHLYNEKESIDVVASASKRLELATPRIENRHTHGTGCTLSSAICAYISKGEDFLTAIKHAKKFVTGAINAGFALGQGVGPVDPMFFIS